MSTNRRFFFSILASRTASQNMVRKWVFGDFNWAAVFCRRFQNRRYKAKRKQLLSQVNTASNTRHAPVTVLVYENHAFSGNSSSSSSSRLPHHKPPLMIPSINLWKTKEKLFLFIYVHRCSVCRFHVVCLCVCVSVNIIEQPCVIIKIIRF